MQIYLPMRIADIRHTSDILSDNAEVDADIRVVMVIPNLIPCKISDDFHSHHQRHHAKMQKIAKFQMSCFTVTRLIYQSVTDFYS